MRGRAKAGRAPTGAAVAAIKLEPGEAVRWMQIEDLDDDNEDPTEKPKSRDSDMDEIGLDATKMLGSIGKDDDEVMREGVLLGQKRLVHRKRSSGETAKRAATPCRVTVIPKETVESRPKHAKKEPSTPRVIVERRRSEDSEQKPSEELKKQKKAVKRTVHAKAEPEPAVTHDVPRGRPGARQAAAKQQPVPEKPPTKASAPRKRPAARHEGKPAPQAMSKEKTTGKHHTKKVEEPAIEHNEEPESPAITEESAGKHDVEPVDLPMPEVEPDEEPEESPKKQDRMEPERRATTDESEDRHHEEEPETLEPVEPEKLTPQQPAKPEVESEPKESVSQPGPPVKKDAVRPPEKPLTAFQMKIRALQEMQDRNASREQTTAAEATDQARPPAQNERQEELLSQTVKTQGLPARRKPLQNSLRRPPSQFVL